MVNEFCGAEFLRGSILLEKYYQLHLSENYSTIFRAAFFFVFFIFRK